MLGWLWRLFIGRFSSCDHRWTERGTYTIYRDNSCTIPSGNGVVLRCEKCGDFVHRKVTP